MTSTDQRTRIDTERQQIREAAQRLLDGTAQRSNGTHTVATLATEAGVSRQRLYEYHADLLAEFKTTTLTRWPAAPGADALCQQLADARDRIRQLETSEAQLKAKITTLCAVITELTHEAKSDNIVAIRRRAAASGE